MPPVGEGRGGGVLEGGLGGDTGGWGGIEGEIWGSERVEGVIWGSKGGSKGS